MSMKTKAQLLAEIKALKKRLTELQAVETKSHQKNDIFKKQTHTLGERVKELNCLYGISSLVDTPGISLPEILQKSAELLPPAGQHPRLTCARIALGDREYKTKNFRETKWKLAGEIKVEGKRTGSVEVFHLEGQSKSGQSPFLKEEQVLIGAIAERLGRIIQRVGVQERVEHLNLMLRAIRNVNQLIIREKNRGVLIREVCNTLTETRGYSTAWIILLDEHGKYLDSAKSGLGKIFTSLLKELKRGNFPACVRQALAQPSPTEITDPSTTCADCPITDKYSDKGRITARLKHADKTYGILSVSFGFDINFDEKELSLFKEVTADIALAMYTTELEEKDKRSVQKLQEVAKFQKTVFETASVAIAIIEEDTTLSMVNAEFEKLSGYSKEELEGKKRWTEFVVAEDLEKMKKLHLRRRSEAKTTIKQYEFQFINREGSRRFILLQAALIPNTKKSVSSLLDITELKNSKLSIRQERDKAQKYLDIAEVMIVALNKEGEITLVNQKGAGILGYEIEDLIGENWHNTCVPAADRVQAKKIFNKFIKGEFGWGEHFEQTVITRLGEERIIDWHSTPLWERDDDEKHKIGLLSSGEDITEQKLTEEKLRQSEEHFRVALENSPIIVSNQDKELRYTWVYNPHPDFDPKTVLGKTDAELLPVENAARLTKIKRRVLETGVKAHEEVTTTIGGQDFIYDLHIKPLRDPSGAINALNCVSIDITKRVRTEKLLKALNQASVAMGKATTQRETFNAVAKQLKELGYSTALFPIDETHSKLLAEFIGYDSKTLKASEKLLGFQFADFRMPIDSIEVFNQVIREKKTYYLENVLELVKQTLPKYFKKIAAIIPKDTVLVKGICAPLIIDGESIGLFAVSSKYLTLSDLSIVDAFSYKLASAWNKAKLVQDLKKTVDSTIHVIAATVEARDPYTASHQTRVAALAAVIASEMGLDSNQVEGITMAGIIHDLGKIRIPAEILSKPGKLNDLEFNLIKTHPQVGFDLLKDLEFPWPIDQMVLQHHERMDGSGYPQGLKGDEILIEARILACGGYSGGHVRSSSLPCRAWHRKGIRTDHFR